MNLSTEQVLGLLDPLIEEGRLTGNQVFLDGLLILDDDAANALDETATEYDLHGYSLAVNKEGAVTMRLLDERIAHDLQSPDPIVVAVAKATPQFYFVNIDRGQDDAGAWQRNCNYNKHSFLSAWSGRFLNSASLWADAKYENKETGELLKFQFFLTNRQRLSRQWRKTPKWDSGVGRLPNHMTYSMGVFSLEEHPEYEAKYLEKGGQYALEAYEDRLAGAHKPALSGRQPGFGPSG